LSNPFVKACIRISLLLPSFLYVWAHAFFWVYGFGCDIIISCLWPFCSWLIPQEYKKKPSVSEYVQQLKVVVVDEFLGVPEFFWKFVVGLFTIKVMYICFMSPTHARKFMKPYLWVALGSSVLIAGLELFYGDINFVFK